MVQRKKRSRSTTGEKPASNSKSDALKGNNVEYSITEKMSEKSSHSETVKLEQSKRVREKESSSIRKSIVSTDNPKKVIDQSNLQSSDQYGLEGLSGMEKTQTPQNFDGNLYRGPRVFVPIDLQAFVVPPTSSGKFQESPLSGSKIKDKPSVSENKSSPEQIRVDLTSIQQEHDGRTGFGLPPAFDQEQSGKAGVTLETGIHLFWAMPDSLMRGDFSEEESGEEYFDPEASIPGDPDGLKYGEAVDISKEFSEDDGVTNLSDKFDFAQLPDRWVIVRQHRDSESVPGYLPRISKCWVLESDTGVSSDLSSWSAPGRTSVSDEMTAIGPSPGDIYWTVTYDNAKNRFTFHDIPEDGLSGPFDYIVMGWYSEMIRDPLWVEESTAESDWHETVKDLGWEIHGLVDEDPAIYPYIKSVIDFMGGD
tara:strand:+ start:3488 stop:4753 length:1266 start_codon:yes stop_codon:yes gene_type:complete